MTHKKLSLDKLNVVRLNETQNILGGRLFDDRDTAGIGGGGIPRSQNQNNGNGFNLSQLVTTMHSITTKRATRSSAKCLPVSPWSRG